MLTPRKHHRQRNSVHGSRRRQAGRRNVIPAKPLTRWTIARRLSTAPVPTLADICLAGQAVGSQFFDVSLDAYPTVKRIVDTWFENEAFARAHPLEQPGAPEKVGH